MKSIRLRIILILLMLVPVPFSCKEDCSALLDLYVEPYFQMQDLVFAYVDEYTFNEKTEKLMFKSISQNFDSVVYSCEKMAMYFQAPDTALLFHSQNTIKKRFGFMHEAIACSAKQPGYAGTLDLVEKIDISSNYDYDDMHHQNYDLSDIVKIFAYTTNGENGWADLDEYNKNAPYQAPKRFYLLLKQPPTLSKVQQFHIRYYMVNQNGGSSRLFEIVTPVFHVKTINN